MRAWVCHTQIFLIAFVISIAGCGGGGETGGVASSPPAPDFSIAISSTSISLAQGSTSAPVNISVTPQNGFSGSVQVTLTGLPSGVTCNPASPFSVAAGQTVSVLFGADFNASAGQFNLTAQGTSGALSHSR